MTRIETAVVGCGLVGRAWAVSFARGGHRVALYDERAGAVDAALEFIDGALAGLAERDLLEKQSADDVRDRLRAASSLADALDGVGYVQESTFEDVAVKRDVFAVLDAKAPAGALLASSSSAILPSAFTEHLPGRARCLVAHPINPPYLVPAVEVVPAPWTDAQTCTRAARFLEGIGHAPIMLKREIDGFVVNRLQGVLLHEAFRLIAGDYADAEDVDKAIKDGLGLRWSFMGPFETIDLNAPGGIRDYVERYEPAYRKLAETQRDVVSWQGELLERIEAERAARLPREALAERQAWRDRRLMDLAAHKRRAD